MRISKLNKGIIAGVAVMAVAGTIVYFYKRHKSCGEEVSTPPTVLATEYGRSMRAKNKQLRKVMNKASHIKEHT
jgi:hypothetical protein